MGGITCVRTMPCMLLNSLACDHITAHLVCSMPIVGMDPLLVQAQFRLSVHVVPLVVHVPAVTHYHATVSSSLS